MCRGFLICSPARHCSSYIQYSSCQTENLQEDAALDDFGTLFAKFAERNPMLNIAAFLAGAAAETTAVESGSRMFGTLLQGDGCVSQRLIPP